jgi:NTP pyrophosphatase (non-canonical NTP hydrolase)
MDSNGHTFSQRQIHAGLNILIDKCHGASKAAGWYHNPSTGEPIARNVPEMLCLIHSEVSEAMEGFRKSLVDDKLPHRPMIEVELADAIIRIADLCGYLGVDLAGAVIEKMEYNARRADHKPEARAGANGKKF